MKQIANIAIMLMLLVGLLNGCAWMQSQPDPTKSGEALSESTASEVQTPERESSVMLDTSSMIPASSGEQSSSARSDIPSEYESIAHTSPEPSKGIAISTQPHENPAVSAYLPLELGNDMILQDISRFTGTYLEDGSDEYQEDICAVVLKNAGDKSLQYAKLELTIGAESYNFEVTTLLRGEQVLLQEKNKKALVDISGDVSASLNTLAFFVEEPSLRDDIFVLQSKDMTLTLTNKSSETIRGPIYMYYKIRLNDTLLGGITYRVSVGDLAPGESKTAYASHFAEDYCSILFISHAS